MQMYCTQVASSVLVHLIGFCLVVIKHELNACNTVLRHQNSLRQNFQKDYFKKISGSRVSTSTIVLVHGH